MPGSPHAIQTTSIDNRPSSSAQSAVPTTAATNNTPYGFSTAAQANALVALVNELRRIVILNGKMRGQ